MKKKSLVKLVLGVFLLSMLGLGACTQGQQDATEGKGFEAEVLDPCAEDANQEHILCHWAAKKGTMKVLSGDQPFTMVFDVEYNPQGYITKISITNSHDDSVIEYSKTYDDEGRISTFTESNIGPQSITTEDSYVYKSSGEIQSKTRVRTDQQPQSPFHTFYSYTYLPNSDLKISGVQKDKDENVVANVEENYVYTATGKIDNKEEIWYDGAKSLATSWRFQDNNYVGDRLINSTTYYRPCDANNPCDPSQGVGSMNPQSTNLYSLAYDSAGKLLEFSQSNTQVPDPNPVYEITCTPEYVTGAKISMVPDHPWTFLQPDMEIISFPKDEVLQRLSCEGYGMSPQKGKVEAKMTMDFELQRLYQIVGVNPPAS